MTSSGSALSDDHSAYLRRLGFDAPPPPTLESLVALHRAHLDAVPDENLDIMPLDDLRALWERTTTAHRAWVAAGRP
jgi:arylamine N-acetyltransferase